MSRCCTGRPGRRPRVGWGRSEPSIVEGRLPCRSKPIGSAGTHSEAAAPGHQLGGVRCEFTGPGSLTVWFTAEAIEVWRAEPRTGRGGQPRYSRLAITTALTLRAVFGLAQRQTEGLIGSLPATARPRSPGAGSQHPEPPSRDAGGAAIAVQLRFGARASAGGQHWPAAVRTRRVADREARQPDAPVVAQTPRWCGADTGRIVASALTDHNADDGSQVGPLLDQVPGPLASFTADGAYDRDDVYAEVAARHPDVDISCRRARARS